MKIRDLIPGVIGGRDPKSWYEVERVDDKTFAIHERTYWQRNINYLLVGDEAALVVDTGSGLSDLASVARSLTSVPVAAMATHLHWDHIGCHAQFADVVAPHIDGGSQNPNFRSTLKQTLTPRRRTFTIARWVSVDDEIDLGGRSLKVLHTPGHTPDSISLFDEQRGQLFVGDLLYRGVVSFGIIPGSDLHTSIATARKLQRLNIDVIHGGHYGSLPGSHMEKFGDALSEIAAAPEAGEGRGYRRYRLHDTDVVLMPWAYRSLCRARDAGEHHEPHGD